MEITQEGFVKTETANGIARITFYHPSHNSLPSKLLRALVAAIDAAAADTEAKVVILVSEGERTFCAGASFDELASITDIEAGKTFFSGFANVINAMRRCPKFVIVRVQGKAIGGGVGIASAADYCFGTTQAAVKLSELAVGIGPFVIGPAVERKMGLSAFAEMGINATEFRSASWAHTKGLFNDIFETTADMDTAIDTLANRLAASNPEAMTALKTVFWQNTEHWDTLLAERAAISGTLVLSDFCKNAIAKFKAKG